LAARPVAAQSIRPEWAEQLSLANIGAGVVQGPSRVTQMALTDGPTADTRYLYMASDPLGLRRATYDLTTAGSLQGQFAQHWVNDRMVDPQGHATDGYFLHSRAACDPAHTRAACGYGISLTTMRLPRTSMTCTRWPAAM
jgi:hypothetical protein